LAKHFALLAARHLPSWEVIDYAHAGKVDAPSGTARELAEALGEVARNELAVPVERTHGEREARGATIAGTQVHSVRLPGIVLTFETLFGLPDERLTIRHDAGSGASGASGGRTGAGPGPPPLRRLTRGGAKARTEEARWQARRPRKPRHGDAFSALPGHRAERSRRTPPTAVPRCSSGPFPACRSGRGGVCSRCGGTAGPACPCRRGRVRAPDTPRERRQPHESGCRPAAASDAPGGGGRRRRRCSASRCRPSRPAGGSHRPRPRQPPSSGGRTAAKLR
jgi:hypothetical protein